MSDSTVSTSTFIECAIGHPPRNPPRRGSTEDKLILSGEYYLDAHRNEIICHQVWTGQTDRGINKVVIWTHQGKDWIVGGGRDEHHTFTVGGYSLDEARRCWNHAVDNGATRVYMRRKKVNTSNDKYQYTKAVEAYMKHDIMEQYLKKALDKYADIDDKYYA